MIVASMALTYRANELLDRLDSEAFSDRYVEDLWEMRSQMLQLGFDTPFSSLVAITRSEFTENKAQEAEDLRKQLGNIRYLAALKKFTLNRTRCAYAAHKFAGAFRKFGMEEYAKFLPLGGGYRKAITDSGVAAAFAYRKLMADFESHSIDVAGASAIISLPGEEGKRTLHVPAEEKVEDKVEKIYGPDAKVEKIIKRSKRSSLIRNFSAKVALFTAASLHGAEIASKAMRVDEEKTGGNLSKYNGILKKHGLVPDADITLADGHENAKKELMEEGILQKNKGEYELDEEFAALLYKRRKRREKIAAWEAEKIVFKLFMHYYLTMNFAQRKAYGDMPSVIAQPEEAQLAVLSHIAPKDYPISHIAKVVHEKISLEGKVPVKAHVLGAAFLCVRAGADKTWVAHEFGLDEKEIELAIPSVKSAWEMPVGRGAAFLEGAKGQD